ncbi:MAG: acetyl/propionyl/methylcrotonyl-CoA carboxylase subunit alpha [Alphaproteobacteria bacterium]
MFDKVLIANRGEIACRIARTARRLGIRTTMVFSDPDRHARHVAAGDEAFRIGTGPARDSYLRVDAIIDAARRSGAQAIHPGYGFLSENADFAEACRNAGLVFIGPTPESIRAMGSKSAAKTLMEKAAVPLVPGYHGEAQDAAALARAADVVGYPVLIKASAGGGGRGMRIVTSRDGLEKAAAAAKREAAAAFGDDRILIERYIERPRHVEVQVFGDRHGNVVHLFERDCSIQRRYQKIIEEAPAPGLSAQQRAAFGLAAVAAARAINYVGAGTIEFIMDPEGRFYFMEMNTRLQVEHPVTEMITGHDLVEWQFRVAAGEPLPCRQDDLEIAGHAFEVRLYAEDAARNFMPSVGRLHHLRLPAEGPHVRVDSGVAEGDEISVFYDPMIAKLIVWDADRAAAIRRMRGALSGVSAVGVTTNVDVLSAIFSHPDFASGAVHTGFIDQHRADLFPTLGPGSDVVLALAALETLLCRRREGAERAARSGDPHSPWGLLSGWRLNGFARDEVIFRDGEREVVIGVRYDGTGFSLELPGGVVGADGDLSAIGDLAAEIGGMRLAASVIRQGERLTVVAHGRTHRLEHVDPLAHAAEVESAGGSMVAPMPGKIIDVRVAEGDTVTRGQSLVVLEAMKMEHTIAASADGRVARLNCRVGDIVAEGVELLVLDDGSRD